MSPDDVLGGVHFLPSGTNYTDGMLDQQVTKPNIQRLLAVSLLAGTLLASPSTTAAAKRIALVIGNSDYTLISKLANPKNDAALMADSLRGVGFEVVTTSNASARDMRRAVLDFGKKLRSAGPDTVGLFYYAGHGVQAKGVNYLIPLAAEIETEADLDIEAVSTSNVLAQMEDARNALNIVILDACRNNPYRSLKRAGSRGLARMDAPSGSLLAFSAGPGQVASDGQGKNSPYTSALATAIGQPGLAIEQVFKRVRLHVENVTGEQQTPWEESSLKGEFYFAGGRPGPAEPDDPSEGPVQTLADREALIYESIRGSEDPSMLEAFLGQFPDGKFAPFVRIKLEQLYNQKEQQQLEQSMQAGTSRMRGSLRIAVGQARNEAGEPMRGAQVTSVLADSPAAQAGIRRGDVIYRFNSAPIDDAKQMAEQISRMSAGSRVFIEFMREDSRMTAAVILASLDRPEEPDPQAGAKLLSEANIALQQGNQRLAAESFSKACELGEGEGCFHIGGFYSEGYFYSQDFAAAQRHFGQACDLGFPDGCSYLGNTYFQRWGGELSERRAAELLMRGCEQGSEAGCNWLRQYRLSGQPNGAEFLRTANNAAQQGNQRLAAESFARACELGEGEGCYYTGLFYNGGNYYSRDFVAARNYFGQACDLGFPDGCSYLGDMYFDGRAGEQNHRLAAELLRRGCEQGSQVGCNLLRQYGL